MADFLQFSKVLLITLMVTLTVCDSLARANSVSRNEKRTIVGGVLRGRSFTAAATGDVTKAAMTSSEDGSRAGAGGSTNSMEEQFLRRLGLERIPLRRSKRSEAMKDAVPGYLTEILKKFQRQTRKNWNRSKQTEEETIVTGVMPYKVFSVDSEMVKVHFHLNAVLKMESMALAEVVVRRQSHASALKERGRVNIRSLVICREAEANESSSNSSSSSSNSSSCRILAHKPVTRHRHFDIYDITRSMQDLRTELQSSMSGSDGGDCPDCSIVMTMMLVHREGFSDVTSGLSDVMLVVSNQPIPESVLNENPAGTVRPTDARIDRSERTPTAKESKITKNMELRDTKRDSSKRRQRREVGTCSLRSWHLDFAMLGWTSWIRYPLGYSANYCSGSCVSASHGTPGSIMTNHAYAKSLYRTALQQNNNNTVHQALIDALPAACCVPVRLSPINILYRNDDDDWILRSMSEMVATQCGCM